VFVVRRLRADDSSVIVEVIDSELRISVPGWMLDESFCDGLSLQENARLELTALRELRGIVDLQFAMGLGDNMGSQSTAAKGEHHGKEPSADSTAGT
jgi:hypothetical protein